MKVPPLILSFSQQVRLGKLAILRVCIRKRMQMEKGRLNYARSVPHRPLSHPHSLANADTPRCKLAMANLLGEGQGEGRELRSCLKLAAAVLQTAQHLRLLDCFGAMPSQ